MSATLPLVFSKAVSDAMSAGKPVVALESTIITHGMPWPDNVGTAHKVEAAVCAEGAEPATIAVLDGQIHIGLEQQELEALGQAKDVMKLSRADFAFAIAEKRTGSTTVAATMIAAAMAGITVFATGGIGGVHRGAETSFDISADLDEFTRTDVTVVCAGAKAILDLNKTIELIETKGIPLICCKADTLPAFWSRDSGIPAPLRMDTPAQIAQHAVTKRCLKLGGGTLVANPVPTEFEIPRSEMETHIEQALRDAQAQNVSGKEVTPYALGRILELTDGKSLQTNVALVLNNARLAAQIAVAEASLS